MPRVVYKGFDIAARTFQIRGTGRWTLDVLIGRRDKWRAFSDDKTFPTEAKAVEGCCEFGRRIIDGKNALHSVADWS